MALTKELIVYKGRTNIITVTAGLDVSADVITSEIRTEEDSTSDLIATWDVSFLTDGVDGELVLTLDNAITDVIVHSNGYMDMKRMVAGEPLPMFNKPLKVIFQRTVTL
jgi:capsid portal protein